jgi:hypothetical protein
MACGNTGSLRVVIRVAPVAEQVPTDDIIKSLNQPPRAIRRVTSRGEQAVPSRRRFVNALRMRKGRNPVAHEWAADGHDTIGSTLWI